MDSKAEMYLRRVLSEIDSAQILFEASDKKEVLAKTGIADSGSSFFSGAISHAYYAIFYCAKAMLLAKGMETKPPEIHKKTLEAHRKRSFLAEPKTLFSCPFKTAFIDSGLLDVKLLMIYREMIVKAEDLLEIYKEEKWKRGNFTYNTIPQANKEPAKESIINAKFFFKHCNTYLNDK